MSPFAAREAESKGYTNVRVFHAGMPVWKKGGNLLVSEPMYIKGMMKSGASYVLVDLRDGKSAQKGHIAGAYNMPGKLKADLFPDDKGAPIILYSLKTANVDAYKAVKKMGYKNVTVLNGGAEKWAASDGKLASGKMPTGKIAYVKTLPKSEISIEEFSKVVKDQPADKIILDARDVCTGGTLPGAVLIPHSKIKENLSMLSKDKEILIHCNTGVMASMAYESLTELGYKARYLNAIVQIDKQGNYEFTAK
ncbi:MAG: hypothetical protein KAR83_03115 [Thermodesulfovibrionales bacterium]|nr:hypothetical protein [Thermodesulfovibrionales bacterium]